MAVTITITSDINNEQDRDFIRGLLGTYGLAAPPALSPVAPVPPAASVPDVPTPAQVPATPAPAAAPDPTLTEEYMREQFRLVAMKPGLREAAFAVLSKYGDGKRTLDAVANTHFPAMLAEWQALGA